MQPPIELLGGFLSPVCSVLWLSIPPTLIVTKSIFYRKYPKPTEFVGSLLGFGCGSLKQRALSYKPGVVNIAPTDLTLISQNNLHIHVWVMLADICVFFALFSGGWLDREMRAGRRCLPQAGSGGFQMGLPRSNSLLGLPVLTFTRCE